MKNVYEKTLDILFGKRDEKFREFSEKIVCSKRPLIGVRTADVRKAAESAFKENAPEYLENCKFLYYEDTLVYGLIIAKTGYKEFVSRYRSYLEKCDCWANIDSFVPSIKCLKNKENRENFFEITKDVIFSREGFELRFYIVALMVYFLDEEHISFVLSAAENLRGKGYYNDMAIAWLLSVAYIKFPTETERTIFSGKLDDFTRNKTISKISDSYRVSAEEKARLKDYNKRLLWK